jgi:isochorismate hydrolase
MREYITEENLDNKVQEWLSKLPHRRKWKFPPKLKETALLVIDMQRYFLSKHSHAFLPAGIHIIERINSLARYIKENEGMIIYTRHLQKKGDEGIMAEWWQDIIRDNEMADIDERIDVMGPVLTKNRYSPFLLTNIEKLLKNKKNIFISGVMTDVCCATAARDAFVRDYKVFFLADATATTCEEYHVATLVSLSHGVAEVLSCEEALQRLL